MTKQHSELKIGVFLSYISKIITLLVGLIYTPIMIRLLGQSEYGLYNIAASVIAYLGILNLGFGSAYMRFYSRYKVEENSKKIATLNGMFFTIFSVLGIIAIIAGVILAFNVELIFGPSLSFDELNTAKHLMLILVVNLGISFPNIVFSTYLQANEKFISTNLLLILRQVSIPLVNLPILLSGYGSVGMVLGTTMVNLFVEILTAIYAVKKMNMKFSFRYFDWSLMREMSVFSFYIFINMIIDQVNWNIDKTLLGRYRGALSVAVYSVAALLNNYYQQISTAISNVFTPRVHRMVSSNAANKELTDLFIRVGRVQFIILSLVMSGVIFFGKPFIALWAGDNYTDAYPMALFLMLPVTIPLIQNVGIEIQRAKNMHKFRSWLYLAIAVVNFIITIPLSIKFGGIGAAASTGLALFIGNGIIMNVYNHMKIGLDMIAFWKAIFKFIPAFILPSIYGVIINRMFDLYLPKILLSLGILYVVIFALSMWFFGMNEYEKNLVRNPFGN